jgi:hypothetical protein
MSYRNWLPELGIGIGIVISILLALNFAELISSKEIAANHKAEQTTAEQQTPEQPAEKTQFRIIPSNSPTDPTTEQHDAGSAQNAQPGADDHLIWGDGIAQWIVAVTGIAALGISAWAVWLVARSLKLNRKMLREAEKATRASSAAVAVTYKTAERQLRAYLFVTGKAIVFKPDEPLRVVFAYENAGQTPAYDVKCYRVFVDAPYPLPEEKFLPESIEESEARQDVAARAVIYPKGDFCGDQETPFPCTVDGLRTKMTNGRFYFVGFVVYRDAFKRRRTTKFCTTIPGRYIEMAIERPGALIEASFEFTPYYNDAD